MNGPFALRAEALTRHFSQGSSWLGEGGRVLVAVQGVSFSVPEGKTLGLVGESGSGKSTIGRMVLGLLRPTAGRVWLGDTEVTGLRGAALRRARRHMQMVFQDPTGALNPRMTVEEAIGEPFAIHEPEMGLAPRREKVEQLLERVGLRRECASRLPSELSGGQRQRVVIARALALEPRLLVADEPVSALDVSVQAQIVNLLIDLQAERNLTSLFISHDLRVVQQVSDAVAVLYLGRLVEHGPTSEVFRDPCHPYTAALLAAVPDPRPGAKRRSPALAGELPSPLDPPAGCAFHTRCPRRRLLGRELSRRCCEEPPPLAALGSGGGRHAACHFAAET